MSTDATKPLFDTPEAALRFLQQESVIGFRGASGLSTSLLLAVLEHTPPNGRDEQWNARIETARAIVAETPDMKLKSFGWCFSHGILHEFYGPPWCTADWMPLRGKTSADALRWKQHVYGDAQFSHQLPDQIQLIVMDVTD